MKAARGVDIVQRQGEDQSIEEPGHPGRDATPRRSRAPTDDVVACVDGLEQRIQMRRCPGLDRSCHENQRQVGVVEASFQSFRQTELTAGDNSLLNGPTQLNDPFGQRGDDGFRLLLRQLSEEDDPDAGTGQGVALKMGREGVVEVLARRHSSSRRARSLSWRKKALTQIAPGRPTSARPLGGRARPTGARVDPALPSRWSDRRSRSRAEPRRWCRPRSLRRLQRASPE